MRNKKLSFLLFISCYLLQAAIVFDDSYQDNEFNYKSLEISNENLNENDESDNESDNEFVNKNLNENINDKTIIDDKDNVIIDLKNNHLFSLATGYSDGLYHMFGTIISAILSKPEGSLSCKRGGSCGVNDLIIIALTSKGSIYNLDYLRDKKVDSAFVQSNDAYEAYSGSGAYINSKPQQELRAIASIYSELLHLVVKKQSNINSIDDLRNKKVGLGSRGSGTFFTTSKLLAEHGITDNNLLASYDYLQNNAEMLENDSLDAFFFLGGAPVPIITYLCKNDSIEILPINTTQLKQMLKDHHYFSESKIIKDTYPCIKEDVETLAVHALILTNESEDEELIYEITRNLWTEKNRPFWTKAFLPRDSLNIDNALDGIGIPLHKGALRYYNEIGKRF